MYFKSKESNLRMKEQKELWAKKVENIWININKS
jgi:hypothetical protein